ncbi:alpha/beta hydrolase [Flavobacterium sp. F52]|uniref:alpha/beta hydrolase n=1 Tax=Flavobacterium sp. F52 TaxID=1202532 RepID=UPI000272F2BC|nr:alpha/beta hydrolase [Flavobacterium sp. F52]EJG02438.1 alpha/beta hydrolase fold-3 protein domain-containing protein [Flavobacterium sp. F52]
MKTIKVLQQSLFIATLLIVNTVASAQERPYKGQNDPEIFTEVRSFLNALNSGDGKPLEQLSVTDARNVLVGAQKSVQVDYSGIEETEKVISQNGLKVKIHITKPKGAKANAPVFIFIHGGGWVLGDYPTHRRLVRDLAVESGAVAVFPDYTPSPEAKYPVAINEIYAATQWVSENGKEIGVDGKNLAVVGNSVGGNMTAAITLMAKDKKGPHIKLQVLLWPVTDANFETESYNLYANGRFLTKNMMKWFWDNYLPDTAKRTEKYASPLQASLAELKGLPPALVQTAENDVLRDEGEAYARKLNEAGVPVTLTRYNGLIHDYGLLNPIANVPAIQTAIQQAAIVIKTTLK